MKIYVLRIIIIVFVTCLFSCQSKNAEEGPLLTDTTFNPTSWKNGDQDLRGRMINDIVDSKVLLGYDMFEVRGLLGPPSEQGKSMMTYSVNMRTSDTADNFMLLNIELDSTSGMVKDYWITN